MIKRSTYKACSGWDGRRCLVHARCTKTPDGLIATAQYLDVEGSDLFSGILSAQNSSCFPASCPSIKILAQPAWLPASVGAKTKGGSCSWDYGLPLHEGGVRKSTSLPIVFLAVIMILGGSWAERV